MEERDVRLGRETGRDARMYPATHMAAHCRARRRIQWQRIAPSSDAREWLNHWPLRPSRMPEMRTAIQTLTTGYGTCAVRPSARLDQPGTPLFRMCGAAA